MASTLTAATLKVRISESCTLNNKDHGAIHTKTISNINMITKRQFNIAATSTITVAELAADPSGTMKYDSDLVKYIRITNTDTENHVTLRITNSNNDECIMKLDAKQTFIFHGDSANGMTAVFDATDGGTTGSTLGTLSSIKAQADTDSVDLEVLVAGT